MNFVDALKKAMDDQKEIALPSDEHCENNGYLIRLKPFRNNLVCKEFYGINEELNQFSLAPKEMLRDDWEVI